MKLILEKVNWRKLLSGHFGTAWNFRFFAEDGAGSAAAVETPTDDTADQDAAAFDAVKDEPEPAADGEPAKPAEEPDPDAEADADDAAKIAEAKKAEDAKNKPAVTVESLQAQMQKQTEELTAWRNQQNDNLKRIVADLDAREQAISEREQAIQAGTAAPAKPGKAGEAADPNTAGAGQDRPWKGWETVTPEEDNFKLWLDHLADQMEAKIKTIEEKFGALPKSIDQRLQPLEARTRQDQETAQTQQIQQALAELKPDFPDLVDGGEKEDALILEAADLADARIARIKRETEGGKQTDLKPLTLQEALSKAARTLGYDTAEGRARDKFKKQTSRASAARTESPGQAHTPASPTPEEIASEEYDKAIAATEE